MTGAAAALSALTVRGTPGRISRATGRGTPCSLGVPRPGIPPRPDTQLAPRLLNLREAAAYLSCSYWSVRDWCLAGTLPIVALPGLRARQGERIRTSLRRVLIDRSDLDAFIERHKAEGNIGRDR